MPTPCRSTARVILALAVSVVSACGGAAEDREPQTASGQLHTLEYQGFLNRASSLTAVQVAMGFERNATDMASRFRGDWVKVLGVVGSVSEEPTAAVVVGSGLGGDDKVVCQPLERAWVSEVATGQPIVVLGKGHEDAGRLILSDCVWETDLAPDVAKGIVPEALPKNLSAVVTKTDVLGTTKRTIHVRLGEKLTKGQLHTLAFQLKYEDPAYYEQTRILFRIPPMARDAGAWATAVLEDELKLTIHGLSLEVQRELGTSPPSQTPAGAKIVGMWFGEGMGGSKLTIYEDAGALRLIRQSPPAPEPARKSLKETPSEKGRRFEEVGDEDGVFYLLAKDGNLQSWDGDGMISTEQKAG